MKIQISTKNEHKFIPDFQGNLKLPKAKQFAVLLKRSSQFSMNNDVLTNANRLDMVKYLTVSILRFENNIILEDESGNENEMTIDQLVNAPELSDLASMIFTEAVKLNREGIDRKKS